MSSLNNYVEFAIQTALEAGRLTLDYFQKDIDVDSKEDGSPVSIADKNAEELIRSRVTDKYPEHAVVGEEFGEGGEGGSTHRWFVDPIDGTRAFVHGVPLYAVLLGLEIEGTIEVGVAHFPALNETVSAASGLGCFWNSRPAKVSTVEQLDQSYVAFTNPSAFAKHGRREEWERIKAATCYQAGWTDAYGHALVATGRVEMTLDPIMKPWDCGPFPVILREAGGYFGDWSGNETIYGNEALSTTRVLLPKVLDLIKGD